MIKIYSGGEKITYTAGDTFEITVTCENEFENNMQLRFQVAQNEDSDFVINLLFDLTDGCFEIFLPDKEKEKLLIGEYVYKMAVIKNTGEIITRKSGELIVKWGA